MNNLIQWPRAQYWDKPWNPISGCRYCSPVCDNCYARGPNAWNAFQKSFHPKPNRDSNKN